MLFMWMAGGRPCRLDMPLVIPTTTFDSMVVPRTTHVGLGHPMDVTHPWPSSGHPHRAMAYGGRVRGANDVYGMCYGRAFYMNGTITCKMQVKYIFNYIVKLK